MSIRFEDLCLSQELLRAISDLGFEEPSPIQAQSIPLLLEGKDLIGQAQTGTGKTASFGIPVLEKISSRSKKTQALILCPTRELAIQVATELNNLSAHKKGVQIIPIYGGQPIDRQLRALAKGAHIVVGTPGRVQDHLNRGTLSLSALSMIVLDEADEMLDMGFREDIENILNQIPESCQRVLFSATMAVPILNLGKEYLKDPEYVKITQKELTVPLIAQYSYEVRPHIKMDALCRLLDAHDFRKALIFCSTKRSVDEINVFLQSRGYLTDCLHGNLVQSQRDRVMQRFRSGKVEILVATDVAARGLDVDDVDAVINYDIPTDVENYVHRIGRTGRAGREGSSHTFVTPREYFKLRDIIRYTQAKITPSTLPTLRDVNALKVNRLLEQVRETIQKGGLEHHLAMIEHFLEEELNSVDVAAALLKIFVQKDLILDQNQEDPLSVERKYEQSSRKGSSNSRSGEGSRRSNQYKREDMEKLIFYLGHKMRVEPKDFVGAITGEVGLPGNKIGAIDIHDSYSYVDVPKVAVDDVMRIMSKSFIRGQSVRVERAGEKGPKTDRHSDRKGSRERSSTRSPKKDSEKKVKK